MVRRHLPAAGHAPGQARGQDDDQAHDQAQAHDHGRDYVRAQDRALAALALQVDHLARDVADLARIRDDLAAHARAIDALTRLVHHLGTTPDPAAGADVTGPGGTPELAPVPEWLSVTDPAQAVAWLADLVVWVGRVWARYPAADLQACWPWHPAVVAELLTVRHAWAEATLPGQSVLALAAWHDRWRPAAMHRINRAMTGCDRGAGCHVNPAGHHYHYNPAYLDELAHWWATTPHPDPDTAPGLTRETAGHPRTPTPTPAPAANGLAAAGRIRQETPR
jgi:hypothetical protein